ncbi:MAG TPA: hypothetical protein VMP01_13100 [Pirellulaceae bacterium]|nr:hypothetical protein [Pirellulaceae bacterium]
MASFPCPFCGARLKHSEKLVGRRMPCPNCNKAFDVPPLGEQDSQHAPGLTAESWEPPEWTDGGEHGKLAEAVKAGIEAARPIQPKNRKPSPFVEGPWASAWSSLGAVMLMVTLFGWFVWALFFIDRFKDDNAYGATANALEHMNWHIRIAGGLIVAGLFMLLGAASMLRAELRLLRKQIHESENRNR